MRVYNVYAAEICGCHCHQDRSHSLADTELQSNEACREWQIHVLLVQREYCCRLMTSVPLNYGWQVFDRAWRSLSHSPSTSSQLPSGSVCTLPFRSWTISLEAFDWGPGFNLEILQALQ